MTEPALRGLFDHAGMFPPAAKPLAGALADAARFASSLARPGLVGADLVLAWKDWPALDDGALEAAGVRGVCRVALVGVPLADGPKVGAAVATHNLRGTRRLVVSLEVHADGDLDATALRATAAAAAPCLVFVEPRWPPHRVAREAEAVANVAREAGAGLKVRCAGPTALDRPALAAALTAAADAGIPFKATQGLHHPVPGPGAPHGFLGLLAAVRLRQADPDFPHVEECLAETDPAAFRLEDGVAWRGHAVSQDRLAKLPPFAIGSCSLHEPDDDLMQAFGPAPAS